MLLPLFLLPDLAMSQQAEPAGGEPGGLQSHTRLRQLDVGVTPVTRSPLHLPFWFRMQPAALG